MVREMNPLSDLQIYEKLQEASNLTLCFDGTTQKEYHLNEVHLAADSTPSGTVLLGLGDLVGGKACGYHNHILQGFDDLAETSSMYTQKPQQEIVDSLTASVSGVITDRCIVNHAVVAQLQDTWDTKLIEMKCNVHPLGVASSANKVLRNMTRPNPSSLRYLDLTTLLSM